MINYTLLHGIITDHHSGQLKKNFRNLIIDLKSTLRKDNFHNFQNVFLYIVAKNKLFDAVVSFLFILITFEKYHYYLSEIFLFKI